MSTPKSRAKRLSWLRSLTSALPAPGYWTLTATWRPSCQTARCTRPIDAAAAGRSSNPAKQARHRSPISPASTLWITSAGSGGADSCNLARAARYGPAISGGSAASETDSACPSFNAPPLSSPRTLKTCSAVRCWISWATTSAGRPPSRLPVPSAARPANPAGNLASLAARVTPWRGRPLMIPFPDTPALSITMIETHRTDRRLHRARRIARRHQPARHTRRHPPSRSRTGPRQPPPPNRIRARYQLPGQRHGTAMDTSVCQWTVTQWLARATGRLHHPSASCPGHRIGVLDEAWCLPA